jgi:hypothetical protein
MHELEGYPLSDIKSNSMRFNHSVQSKYQPMKRKLRSCWYWICANCLLWGSMYSEPDDTSECIHPLFCQVLRLKLRLCGLVHSIVRQTLRSIRGVWLRWEFHICVRTAYSCPQSAPPFGRVCYCSYRCRRSILQCWYSKCLGGQTSPRSAAVSAIYTYYWNNSSEHKLLFLGQFICS